MSRVTLRLCSWFAIILFFQTAMVVNTPAVTLQLVAQLDTASLNAGVPGSVAAHGNDVYIGNLFLSGLLHHITSPLSSPTNINTFGGLLFPGETTNGYVSLNTDGTTLVAATNNGGEFSDIVQVYAFGSDILNWESDSLTLGIFSSGNDRIDGAAVDPITGEILITGYGNGNQHLYLPDTLQSSLVDPNPSIIYDPGVGTGWRDIDYDATTGNLYLRAIRGIAKGVRDNMTSHDYTRPDGTGPGIQTIVNLNDGFDSAINIEFLPASFAGQDLLIVNRRVNPNTFAEQIELYDPNAIDTQVAITFLAIDGSPFTTANADSGIYDFSYDPIHELLYISDFSTSQIHIFGVPGGPAADFNGDGNVTREDLLIWQTSFGIDDGGDADADGDTDGNDFLMWQSQFGSTSGNGLFLSTIPEPQSMFLIAVAFSLLWIRHRIASKM